MSLNTEKSTVDGFEVTSTQLPVFRSAGLFFRWGEALGPVLPLLLAADSIKSVDIESLGPVLATMFSKLRNGEGEALIEATLPNTSVLVDGRIITLDSRATVEMVFNGRLLTVFKIAIFALKVNFRDFFSALPAVEKPPAPAPEKKSTLMHTSRKRGRPGVSG